MSIAFPAIIIYLLPGFFAFVVYKNSVQEDLEKRAESTQIAIMLLFGVSGIAMLFGMNFILSPFPGLAECISPSALLPIKTADDFLILPCDTNFWLSYGMLSILTIVSSVFWALLSEKSITPTRLLSRGISKYVKHGGKIPCESAIRALTDELQEKGHGPSFVKVYKLGNSDYILGWWNGYSESEKEVSLTLLECCDVAKEFRRDFNLQTRKCLINYASGMVIEFLDIDEEAADAFLNHVKAEYKKQSTKSRVQ